jgi:hypothetical protein
MVFLFGLFKKALSPLLYLAILIAKQKIKNSDLKEIIDKIGQIFIPGVEGEYATVQTVNPDGSITTIQVPLIDNKSSIVRSIGAVMCKELFTNVQFLQQAGLNREQAGKVLVAAVAVIQPNAADEAVEVAALMQMVPEIPETVARALPTEPLVETSGLPKSIVSANL